jgi:hypothetical protein
MLLAVAKLISTAAAVLGDALGALVPPHAINESIDVSVTAAAPISLLLTGVLLLP